MSIVLIVLLSQRGLVRIKRFEMELISLADEGIEFTLPAVVVDHVADTEENLSCVKNKIKRCAKEGIKEGEV